MTKFQKFNLCMVFLLLALVGWDHWYSSTSTTGFKELKPGDVYQQEIDNMLKEGSISPADAVRMEQQNPW